MGFLILWETPVGLGGKKDALAPFAAAEDLVTAVLPFAADDELPAAVLCGGAAEVALFFGGPGAVAEAEDALFFGGPGVVAEAEEALFFTGPGAVAQEEDALCAGDGAVAAPPAAEEALLAGMAASGS